MAAGSSSGAVTQSTQQAETSAINDINALTQNQIKFEEQMNDAKTALDSAKSMAVQG